MSDSAFVAAIRPQSYGSSTTGVKKSVVSTSAGPPSGLAITAASSPESSPTSSSPYASGTAAPTCNPATTASSSPGGILHAQPPPCAYCVRRVRVVRVSPGEAAAMPIQSLSPGNGSPGDGPDDSDRRRRIPATGVLLAVPEIAAAAERLGRTTVKESIVAAQDRARRGEIGPDEVAAAALAMLPQYATSLRPVVNATGVIVHTNLGRAPLSAAARDALCVAAGTSDVEYELST